MSGIKRCREFCDGRCCRFCVEIWCEGRNDREVTAWWEWVWVAIACSLVAPPAQAQTISQGTANAAEASSEEQLNTVVTTDAIPRLTDLEQPATTVEEWISQFPSEETRNQAQGLEDSATPNSLVQITEVRVNPTEAGLQVILQTVQGELSVPTPTTVGNALIVDIANAALSLPDGDEFQQANPAEGIALVSVTGLPDNRVRVAITGTDAPPVAEMTSEAQGLVLAVTLGDAEAATEEDAIQVVVTGEQDEGYNPSSATTATRTATPLRDIPQSIQVVPQDVIRDQRATTPNEALQNVPGVSLGADPPRTVFSNGLLIRGFDVSENTLTNGLQDPTNRLITNFSNIERIEVLKGPSSVLFGQGTVGGIVNYVTEQPLTEPYYSLEASIGNFDLYGGELDLSGPLNEQRTLLYRLNGFIETNESFVDFVDRQRYQIAPVLTWQISDQTELTIEADYSQVNLLEDFGIPAAGTILPNPNGEIPLDRFVGEPDSGSQTSVFRIGYNLEHRFNDNWQLRSAFKFAELNYDRVNVFPLSLEEDLRTLTRRFADQRERDNIYNLDNYIVGEFATGSIQHKLLAGFNLYRRDLNEESIAFDAASLDIFNPVYGIPRIDEVINEVDRETLTQSLGLYVQDQIDLTDNLIVLLGGRFDIASQDVENRIDGSSNFNQEEAFSPRVGVVYQPIEPISLYASFTRSFQVADPSSSISGSVEPERGTQYEIGVKGDISDRLSATLAFYHLTRTNVETTDPDNPLFTIQTGEQRSRGIELNVSGEILPSWNILAGYAYTDAEITEDNDLPVGNRLPNVPEHAFNFWTTYTLQSGSLEGLGFGLGLFFEGDRQGDLDNSFELPSYIRTDAAIFYERDRFRAAINFRNLFDNEFFVFAANDTRVSPGDPFTVIGSISYEF